jgi:hypothetical protein
VTPGRFQALRLLLIGALAATFAVFGLGVILVLGALQFPWMLPLGLVALAGGAAGHFAAIARLDKLRRARSRGLSKEALNDQVRTFAASRGGTVTVDELVQALGLARGVAGRTLRGLAAAGECEAIEREGGPAYTFGAAAGREVAVRARLSGTLLGWAGALSDTAVAAATERSRELTLDVLARDATQFARRAGGAVTPAQVAAALSISGPIAAQTLELLRQRGRCRRVDENTGQPRYEFGNASPLPLGEG